MRDGISIADLQANAEQFFSELHLLIEFGLNFPAARLGERGLVPVALLPFAFPLGVSFRTWRCLYPFDYWRDFLYDELRQKGHLDGETLSPPEARKTFIHRASEFLATRLAALRSLGHGPPGPPPPVLTMAKFTGGPSTKVSGCLFSVNTNSPGLSTHWSGAYYIAWNFHGAPTTPAKGVLQAGTYVFGVTGGACGSNVQPDLNAVCTLPGASSVHLQF